MPEARYFCPIFPLGEYSDLTFWTLVSPFCLLRKIRVSIVNRTYKTYKMRKTYKSYS